MNDSEHVAGSTANRKDSTVGGIQIKGNSGINTKDDDRATIADKVTQSASKNLYDDAKGTEHNNTHGDKPESSHSHPRSDRDATKDRYEEQYDFNDSKSYTDRKRYGHYRGDNIRNYRDSRYRGDHYKDKNRYRRHHEYERDRLPRRDRSPHYRYPERSRSRHSRDRGYGKETDHRLSDDERHSSQYQERRNSTYKEGSLFDPKSKEHFHREKRNESPYSPPSMDIRGRSISKTRHHDRGYDHGPKRSRYRYESPTRRDYRDYRYNDNRRYSKPRREYYDRYMENFPSFDPSTRHRDREDRSYRSRNWRRSRSKSPVPDRAHIKEEPCHDTNKPRSPENGTITGGGDADGNEKKETPKEPSAVEEKAPEIEVQNKSPHGADSAASTKVLDNVYARRAIASSTGQDKQTAYAKPQVQEVIVSEKTHKEPAAKDMQSEFISPEKQYSQTSQHPSPKTPITHSPSDASKLYEKLIQVGEGTYGKVYKGRNRETGAFVALKRIRMETEREGFPITAMREIRLLQSMHHPNIVKLHEVIHSEGAVFMVMEYMDYDLSGLLNHPQWDISVANIKSLMQQMLAGLAYMHKRGILHRDIKGSNLLLNRQGQVKYADFEKMLSLDPKKRPTAEECLEHPYFTRDLPSPSPPTE
ncbi:kinase subunit of RNA polymerase II carboxy-terminal domain kinase I [Mycoemilia scoparia]|uniref:cyclin-dependent kinase n=1 Tax=Mycoemilia scoparia TaxID=417184 RepID=A0A9W8DVF3_9FUNG|nr:kinase subunit of RNA polymerase II carboxy-terminal domain kinase I [Mycoemilia scoparia]